ncbi:MAG: hypothetical protein HC911_14825, partial [Chloroflexaceae bacterium]|nr:hypothetical protein [Chloroflexaceae bacterium]
MNTWKDAWFLIGVLVLLLAVPGWQARAVPSPQAAELPAGLFAPIAGGAQVQVSATPQTIRERLVTIDFGQLLPPALAGQPPASVSQLPLNLFGDATYTAVLTQLETAHLTGNQVWIGTLAGIEQSTVILVYQDGLMQGQIVHPLGTYTVRYAGKGVHRISQIDSAAFVDHDQPLPLPDLPLLPDLAQQLELARQADDGAVQDLLIVYTATARQAAGGTAAMQALIDLGVATTNQSYRNSQVQQWVWLVHTAEVNYTETGNANTDLQRLRNLSDGFIDEIHTWRDEYHADYVALVLDNIGGGCGLGYVLTSLPNSSFAAFAFSVIARNCIADNYTLPHELGHNMGLRHDWYVDDDPTPFTDARGFANVAGKWRTVMAYNDLCVASGTNCSRVPFFSNPAVQYNSTPLGVVRGTNATCVAGQLNPNPETCDANATRVLNISASNGAGYRASEIVWTGDSNSDWSNPNNWRMAQGANNAQTINRVPRSIDDVVIPATPDGSRFPTLSGAASVRDVRIESGAQLDITGGTITVYGDWAELGTARTNAANANLVLAGNLPQSLSFNSDSRFNAMQVGTGTSATVAQLAGTLVLNGDLTIRTGAQLRGGTSQLQVGGNWDDAGAGFFSENGTVVLNGTNQTVAIQGTRTMLDEDFAYRDGTETYTSTPPNGWVTQNQSAPVGSNVRIWFGGSDFPPNSPNTTGGFALRLPDSNATLVDAWLFSPPLELRRGATYRLSFLYGVSSDNPQEFQAWLGPAANATAMSRQLVNFTNVTATTWQNAEQSFTVSADGIYYLGFRNVDTSPDGGYGAWDNFRLTEEIGLQFHNLIVNSIGAAQLQADAALTGSLLVGSGGTLDLDSHALSVEEQVTNSGTLRQSRTVAANSTTAFLLIADATNTQIRYRGVDLTSSGNLGLTTVAVRGGQLCPANAALVRAVQRCYQITPTSNAATTLAFWYDPLSEANGSTNPRPFRALGGGAWQAVAAGGSDSVGLFRRVLATDVQAFGDFALADELLDDVPTATPTATATVTGEEPTATPTEAEATTPTPTDVYTLATPTPTDVYTLDTPTPTATGGPTLATATSTATPMPVAQGPVYLPFVRRAPASTPTPPPATPTPPPATPTAGSGGGTLNMQDRASVQAFYAAEYSPAAPDYGWTGDVAACNAGDTSAAFKAAVLRRVNFYRTLAGVPANVTFTDAFNRKAQQAALMMAAEGSLSHFPPETWACYTAEGREAAENANLHMAIPSSGVRAIDGYIKDSGAGNDAVGHRRWIFFPQTLTMGTGDVPSIDRSWGANALWVFGSRSPTRTARDEFVAWPPPGFVPYQIVYPRWS